MFDRLQALVADLLRRVKALERREKPPPGYLRSSILMVDPAFNEVAALKRFQTISAAMTAATAGCEIRVAPGVYVENVTFTQPGIKLIGGGQPYFASSVLQDGTIIEGVIDCDDNVGLTIRDLGVDIRDTAEIDGIKSGSLDDGIFDLTVINCTLVGIAGGGAGAGHGILCQTGGRNKIRGCSIYHFYHGIALRCSFSIVSDCYIYGSQSNSVIIKSESGSGNAIHNTVTNCVLEGLAADDFQRAGPIRIQAANSGLVTKHNTVSNITVYNSGEAAIMIHAVSSAVLGNVGWNNITNVSCYGGGDDPARAEFDMDTTTDNNFVNCFSLSRAAGYGWRQTSDCARIRAIGCIIDTTGAGKRASGSFLMWQDFGAGGGVEAAVIEGLFQTDGSANSVRLIDRFQQTAGAGLCTTTAETFLRITHTSGTGVASIHLKVIVGLQSGNGSRTYTFDVSIVRPSSATLTCTISTPVVTTSGTITATLAFTADTATSNVVNLQVAASTGTVGYAYGADALAFNASIWTAENLAA